jgi:hypothetical protein
MPRGVSPLDEARLQGRLWTPELLRPSMVFWHDTARIESLSRSGSTVTNIRDLSGRGINLATSGSAPGYSATEQAATFDGSTQGLASSAPVSGVATNGDFTLITLFKPSSSQPNAICAPFDMEHATVPNGPLIVQSQVPATGLNQYYFAFFDGVTFQNIPAPFVTMPGGEWSLVVHSMRTLAGPAWATSLWINGRRPSGWTDGFPRSNGGPGLTANAKKVSVGFAQTYTDRNWAGSFGVSILLNRALNEADAQRATGSILWQRGLQFLLPANHAYRNRPPLIGA